MTFNFAPWAIDGARSTAGLARVAAYASGGGRSGVVKPTDLRVSSLAVPGNGLEISGGSALILNRYLSNVDEAYVATNPAKHTVLAADMPSPKAAVSYYLVCVVVGDPEFNQTGHPFMPSTPLDPADAADFQYVRVVIVPCAAGTTSFEQLGYQYPAYALARLEVPANTSTITNAMITDLRQLTKPRESTRLLLAQPVPEANQPQYVNSGDWTAIWGWTPWVQVPEWATHCEIKGTISSIVHIDPAFVGESIIIVNGVGGAPSFIELTDDGSIGRRTDMTSVWQAGVSQWQGQSVSMSMYIRKISGEGRLDAYRDTTVTLDVRFSERPV